MVGQPDGKNGPVPILGLEARNKEQPPMRIEIREMKKDTKLWTLFLLGLETFKLTNEKDPLSYFQIAGIHGAPLTTWPNEAWNEKTISAAPPPHASDPGIVDNEGNLVQFGGFCTHTSVLFLPWHRPYLALWETQLYRHVNDVAKKFGGEYVELAKDFRMPYWDFCTPGMDKNKGFLPDEVTSTVPDVKWPDGSPLSYNPLYTYNYGDVAKQDSIITQSYRSNKNSTVRYPNYSKGNETDEGELFQRFQQALAQYQERSKESDKSHRFKFGLNLTERSAYILLAYDKFAPMSNNRSDRKTVNARWGNFGSLEDIHNTVHGAVGGPGNMGKVGIAAFDPIFWLHHANIDRLWAIWQALWDDGKEDEDPDNATYVVEQFAGTGTFSTHKKTYQNIETELTPFSASEKVGDFIKSRGARFTSNYGYVYPETRKWMYPTQRKIYYELNRLYRLPSLASLITADQFDDGKQLAESAISNLQVRAQSHIVTKKAGVTVNTMLEAVEQNSAPTTELVSKVASAVEQVELPPNRSVDRLVKDNKYLEWLIDVKAEKHSTGGEYLIHFFIGKPDDSQPYYYQADPRHVSFFYSFGSPLDTGCDKCREAQAHNTKVTGQIPLTMALVERYLAGQVGGLEPEAVIAFLRDNLYWRATKTDGTLIDRATVDGLLVSVVTNEVTLPADPTSLPQYAPSVEVRPEITANSGDGTGLST